MALPISAHTRNRVLAVAAVAACAVSVAVPRPWHGGARATAFAAARLPIGLLGSAHDALRLALDRLSVLPGRADELARLRDDNRALREALARQADETRLLREQLRDHQGFQAFRAATPVRTLTAVPARVLAADASAWRHHLVVDRGTDHGVRQGAAAVWGSSIVGTVVDVRPRAATVRLLSDSRAGITVRVARTGDVGLLRGTGQRGGTLDLKWIHLQRIDKDDVVLTAGLDPIVPPRLVAGRIVEASSTRQPLFYDARVRPLLDLDRLTELLLVAYTPDDVEDLLPEPPAERR